MKILKITINNESYELLKKEAETRGIPKSELLRRIIYEYQRVQKEIMERKGGLT